MSKRFKVRDKKIHKLKRDGLVERNVVTDVELRISSQEQDFDLRNEPAETVGLKKDVAKTPKTDFTQNKGVRSSSKRASKSFQLKKDAFSDKLEKTSETSQIVEPMKASETSLPYPPKFDDTEKTLADTEVATKDVDIGTATSASELRFDSKKSSSYKGSSSYKKTVTVRPKLVKNAKPRLKFAEEVTDARTKIPTIKSTKRRIKYSSIITKSTANHDLATVSDDSTVQKGEPHTPKPYTAKSPTRHEPVSKKRSPKLDFSGDDKVSDKVSEKSLTSLSKYEKKADKINVKLEKARNKLPTKKHLVLERTFDDKKNKTVSKFKFEEKVLPQSAKKFNAPAPVKLAKKGIGKAVGFGGLKLHQKVHQVEHENVGVKAGHHAEMALETAYRGGKRVTRSAFKFIRDRPYKTVKKLEKQARKTSVNLEYQKVLNDNPKLKSNIFSRYAQKRKIKKQYAQALRSAKKTSTTIKKTGDVLAKATKAVVSIIRSHPAVAGTLALTLLLVIFMFSALSSCSSMASGGLSAVYVSSYIASDIEIDAAELAYTEWETDLQIRISKIEQEYPGFDEYRYQIGDISHNPFELMAYLTVVHQDFTFNSIKNELQDIFNLQYKLMLSEEIETRHRTIINVDPETGDEYETEEAYDVDVLKITLTSHSFTDVVYSRMNSEQKEHYLLLLQTKGNRQYLDNPFGFNWLPNVSSFYGYRIHPISGEKNYHKGVDIAVPTGTDILAGHDGTVTFSSINGGYGYVVVVEGENGLVSKYAHCDSLLASVGQQVKKGDIIAKSGNSGNSTGPHLHLEILKNAQYLNPIYFATTGDDGSGIIPPGNPGGIQFPDYSGEPMGDGSYAALIAEAERYLGYPYVWAGSSPSTSFDCSGFVCWVLNQSGVANVGRTTAQGLYNMSTPVRASEAQPGDLIFFHGTYSTTANVTHIGIYVGGGMMIHCGDPISYASINSSYWQQKFYAFGRIN